MTIKDACKSFLDEEARLRNLAHSTVQGYGAMLRSLARWAERNGLSPLEEVDEDAIRCRVGKWTRRASTTRLRLARAKAFFGFAVEPGRAARSLQAAAAKQLDKRAQLLLMRYSGLAIGDAVPLCREALVGTGLTLRRAKSGELVMVDLPHLVVRAINRLRGPNLDHFWWSGKSRAVTTAKYWRLRLREVAARAGIAGFHPHRLRDTFADALLRAGVSIEDVSSLLGHSSIQTMERHYAPWAGGVRTVSRGSCGRPTGWTRYWRNWTRWEPERASPRSGRPGRAGYLAQPVSGLVSCR